MDKNNGYWQELSNLDLIDELGEWLPILVDEEKRESKFLWGELTLEKVTKLVENAVQELKERLDSTKDKAEKKEFQEIKQEAQEILEDVRKER